MNLVNRTTHPQLCLIRSVTKPVNCYIWDKNGPPSQVFQIFPGQGLANIRLEPGKVLRVYPADGSRGFAITFGIPITTLAPAGCHMDWFTHSMASMTGSDQTDKLYLLGIAPFEIMYQEAGVLWYNHLGHLEIVSLLG